MSVRALTAFLASLLFMQIAGCTRVPEIEEKITPDLKAAKYPELRPLTGDLGPLPPPAGQSEQLEASLSARSERAKQRADALKAATQDNDEG
ncbi:MAG: hypothetical protein ACU0BB_13565 [Paracoccaceae bacterium]